MKDTFDELGAVVEDQVIVPRICDSGIDRALHLIRLIGCDRYADVYRLSSFAVFRVRGYVELWRSHRSPEYALVPRNMGISRRISTSVIIINANTYMSEPSGSLRVISNVRRMRLILA